jgi:two-component system cell cycle response regulator
MRDYDVVSARDGSEAWEVLERQDTPTLAILDWKMPGMDGVEVCRRLRQSEETSYVYVIMLTGMNEKQDLVAGLEAGADDYLIKPFHNEELYARLRAGERILKLQQALRVQATHDALTGILNRGTILEILQRELARVPRDAKPVGIILADLDHFKLINDTHGHPVGDAVLRETARRMALPIRPYDALGRYGGEEFLIVLPGCGLTNAAKVAERIRCCIAVEPVSTSAGAVAVSASFGVTAADNAQSLDIDAIIETADQALYGAKRDGRNRIAF